METKNKKANTSGEAVIIAFANFSLISGMCFSQTAHASLEIHESTEGDQNPNAISGNGCSLQFT